MSQPKSICELFQRTAADHADRVALRTPGGGVTITWAEYNRRVRDIAAGLAAIVCGQQLSVSSADAIWRRFAAHYHLFRGTPSSLWLNHVFHEVFGLRVRLGHPLPTTTYCWIGSRSASTTTTPRLSKRYATEPGSPRFPPASSPRRRNPSGSSVSRSASSVRGMFRRRRTRTGRALASVAVDGEGLQVGIGVDLA